MADNSRINLGQLRSAMNEVKTYIDNQSITIPTFSSHNAHASNHLNIETYPAGQNQPMHPKVLYFKNGWNGYKYWMAYTPLPNEDNENPCIAVSNNMIDWTVPPGLENPLAWKPSSGGYNSDTHLVYREDTNTLECWYREIVTNANTETYYRRTTTNGVNWTAAEQTFQSTGSITANLSPALLFEDNKYKMWTFTNSPTINYYESSDGLNWTKIKEITVSGGNWWHADVIHTSKGYEFLIYVNSGGKLYYTKTTDNTTFDNPVVILEPTGTDGDWAARNLYRSSFLMKNGYYYIFYSGQGTNNEWHIGLTRGANIYNLRGLIGAKTLSIGDAIMELHDLVGGGTSSTNVEVENISLNKSTLEVQINGTYLLEATISPSNATDKTITWESDHPEIATVDNGKVKGIAEGGCTITATTSNGKTATCSVTVSQTAETPTDGVVQNNLICWLDGRDGSGTDSTWADRTTYNNDMTLNGFSFNETSGWTGTGLKFDGIKDYCTAVTPNVINGYGTNNPNYITVCLNVTINEIGRSQQDLLSIMSGNKGRFLLLQDNDITYQEAGKLKKTGLISTAGGTYDLVYIYRSTEALTSKRKRRAIYVDSVKKFEEFEDVHNPIDSSYFNFSLGSEGGTTAFANIVVNSIKIYDGELTDEQIQHNYQYEKSITRT